MRMLLHHIVIEIQNYSYKISFFKLFPISISLEYFYGLSIYIFIYFLIFISIISVLIVFLHAPPAYYGNSFSLESSQYGTSNR